MRIFCPKARHYINELARILGVDAGNLNRKLKELEEKGDFKNKNANIMNQIKKESLDLEIKNNYAYNFEIPEDGLYLIEIIASAKSWWQNLKNLRSFFQDDDLAVKINGIEFPKLNGKKGLFDGEVAWNGNNLRGLSKVNIFIISLSKGTHALNFLADKNPILKSVAIYAINETELIYSPMKNNLPQDGNRRPWITIIPVGVSVKRLTINASVKKYPENADEDDIKLIIDGEIEQNTEDKSHKNWFWCGRTSLEQEKEFSRDLNLGSGLHYIELWADRMPTLNSLKIELGDDAESDQGRFWLNKWQELRQYNYKGLNGKENYNRYDKQIIEAVAFWNEEFFAQELPPAEPLDPNLVKAMIFQESRVGYDKRNNGNVNIMQVGNSGDPSLNVLNNQTENPESEMINGKLWKIDYMGRAKVENIYDSVYWGTRWLYHRAQYIGDNGERHWFSWKDAVGRYGPGIPEYVDNIWSIYEKGMDNRIVPAIKLWAISLLFLFPIVNFPFVNNFFDNKSIKTEILNTIGDPYEKEYVKNIQVDYYKENNPLFLTIIETQKDWSEGVEIGNYINGKIDWIGVNDAPTEQDIVSARFLDLMGFNNPIVEVYGKTHMGHGAFYLYEIKDNQASLLLKTPAVDSNNDIRWAPNNLEKYGYGNCGEVFAGGSLKSEYSDQNNDGFSDVILNGTEETVCESEKMDDSEYAEIKVSEKPVEKVFFWDNNAGIYVSK